MGTGSMRGKPNWAQWYYDDVSQNQKTMYRSSSAPSSPAAVHNRSRSSSSRNQQQAPVVDWGVLRHYWKERQKDHGNIYHRTQTNYTKKPGGYVSNYFSKKCMMVIRQIALDDLCKDFSTEVRNKYTNLLIYCIFLVMDHSAQYNLITIVHFFQYNIFKSI